jgi:tRNA(fMet)-specific endonuclease VapC
VDSDPRWIGAKLPPGLWDDHRAFRAGAIGALTMVYLLDTNVAIHLRDGDATATSRVAALEGAILLSVISRVELEGGVYRDPAQAGIRRPRLDAMLAALPVLAFDDTAADAYRQIVEAVGYSNRALAVPTDREVSIDTIL